METWRCSLADSPLAILLRISDGATNPNKTPIATKIATAQIAIFRVRGWRAMPFARSRISAIFGAMGKLRNWIHANLSAGMRVCLCYIACRIEIFRKRVWSERLLLIVGGLNGFKRRLVNGGKIPMFSAFEDEPFIFGTGGWNVRFDFGDVD